MTSAQAIIDVFESEGDRPSAQEEQDLLLAPDVKVRAREPIAVAVNSLSPLQNVFMSSSDSGQTLLARLRASRVFDSELLVDGDPGELIIASLGVVRSLYQPRRLFLDSSSIIELIGVGGPSAQPAAVQEFEASRGQSPVHRAAGVDVLARQLGVSAEVSKISELCMRVVPGADSILVTVARDEEDGSEGLHFEVLTRSEVGRVFESEARLHELLFETLSVNKRQFFTIGYHFAR